jgi:hypothetical protein
MPTTYQHWQEWRERCAVLRCGAETQSVLRDFAWKRFARYARNTLGEADVKPQLPSAEACWHLLECELAVSRLRSGRRYKEWLFARLAGSHDAPIDVIQGGASLLMRTVVRDWALRETRQRRTQSLEAPIGVSGSGLTLADLLPAAPERDVESSDLEQHAESLAGAIFESLDQRARLILLAKQLNLPLYGAELLEQIGTGRSNVSKIWRGVYQQLANRVTERYAAEPRDWQLQLSLLAARRLGAILLNWGRMEKRAQVLFFMVRRSEQPARSSRQEK